jgi:lauroyl/myristoyl acyltransferase
MSAIKKQCIITTFHIGSFFSIVSAVSKINSNICIIIDDRTFNNKINDIKYITNRFSINGIEVINIETLNGFNLLIDGIEKGASLCFFIDGNSGLQGIKSKQNNMEIPFFNSSIYVKTGIPYISHIFKLPIIQLFTIRDENLDNIYFTKGMIIPSEAIERNEYIKTAIFSIWNNFIDILKEYPTQWEGWLYLHRFHIKWSNYLSQNNVDRSKYIFNSMYDLYYNEKSFFVYCYVNEMRFIVSEYIYKIFWKLKISNSYLTIDVLNHYIQDAQIQKLLIDNSILIHPQVANI